jgi:CheY-like chemotaxis protein
MATVTWANYLRKNSFRISLAADGRQMREVLAAGGIDLVVLDLMLPGEGARPVSETPYRRQADFRPGPEAGTAEPAEGRPGCEFHAHSATDSMNIRPPVPRGFGH